MQMLRYNLSVSGMGISLFNTHGARKFTRLVQVLEENGRLFVTFFGNCVNTEYYVCLVSRTNT